MPLRPGPSKGWGGFVGGSNFKSQWRQDILPIKKKRISTIKSDCLQTSISSKAPFDCQKENY